MAPAQGLAAGRALGDFRLRRVLGEGGMGQVWEAEQESVGRIVALKILPPALAASPNALKRFQREARAGARLEHQHVVRVYSVGEAEGVHFLAQELVEGGCTLADAVAGTAGDQIPDGYHVEVARLFIKIGTALSYAHSKGVIHRDIKPSNILIAADDTPKVADFGLALLKGEEDFSRTGSLTGTYCYMSPEQAASRRIGIDHRTDIFSLGAALYECLTLRRAFDGETPQRVLEKVLVKNPEPPIRLSSSIPKDLSVIAMKALEKDREHRYQTMAELVEDLYRFVCGNPIHASTPSLLTRAWRWAGRHPGRAIAGAVILTMTVSFGQPLLVRVQTVGAAALVFVEGASGKLISKAFRKGSKKGLAVVGMGAAAGWLFSRKLRKRADRTWKPGRRPQLGRQTRGESQADGDSAGPQL